MTVFNCFLKLAWRQKKVILIYLSIFVMISILNSGTGQAQTGFTQERPAIKILQQDTSPAAQALTDYLRTQGREVELNITEAGAEEAIFEGAAALIVVIPESFSEDFKKGRPALRVYSDIRQMDAMLLQNSLDKYLMFFKADEKTHGEADPARIQAALETKAQVTLAGGESLTGHELGIEWYRYYFNFLSYILLSVFILVFGNIMNEFSGEALKRRNAIVPFSSTRFQLSLILAQLVLALGITALFLGIGILIKPSEAPYLNLWGHIANAVAFALTALALSFLINSITRNRFVLSACSTMLSLGTAFISGVMIPMEFLAPSVVTLAKFFPTYYYVTATDQIISRTPYLFSIGVQLLFALLFLVVGLTFVRIRQEGDLLPARTVKKLNHSVS